MNPLDKLREQIEKTEGVLDSAVVFVKGVPALIATAVQAALANGATEEQLKPIVTLGEELGTKADALQAAIATNPT
jgi:alkylhydroperoxidase/carboxymuconolactone decarboxylase family protein YurZ